MLRQDSQFANDHWQFAITFRVERERHHLLAERAQVVASYAGVVIKASKDPDAATAFLTWLAGPDGQAILAGYGFLAP